MHIMNWSGGICESLQRGLCAHITYMYIRCIYTSTSHSRSFEPRAHTYTYCTCSRCAGESMFKSQSKHCRDKYGRPFAPRIAELLPRGADLISGGPKYANTRPARSTAPPTLGEQPHRIRTTTTTTEIPKNRRAPGLVSLPCATIKSRSMQLYSSC